MAEGQVNQLPKTIEWLLESPQNMSGDFGGNNILVHAGARRRLGVFARVAVIGDRTTMIFCNIVIGRVQKEHNKYVYA